MAACGHIIVPGESKQRYEGITTDKAFQAFGAFSSSVRYMQQEIDRLVLGCHPYHGEVIWVSIHNQLEIATFLHAIRTFPYLVSIVCKPQYESIVVFGCLPSDEFANAEGFVDGLYAGDSSEFWNEAALETSDFP